MRTVAIIDDETLARIILRGFIEKFFPLYKVVGEANSVESGVMILQNSQPELVFLDIQLNPGTGFNILEALGEYNFHVVFVTAYENFAIEAFRFAAMDYLLKPLSINKIRDSLQRFEDRTNSVIQKLQKQTFFENLNLEDIRNRKIAIPCVDGFEVAFLQEIIRLKSDGNYTRIYKNNGQELIACRTLKEFEELFFSYEFFRVHHSHLINLKYVKKYLKGHGGEIVMSDNSIVPLSRRRKEIFLSLFMK